MTGYETFTIYQALKLHFTQESYDFLKYNGKTHISVNSFENRKDKYHFYKLSRKYTDKDDLIAFLISNFLENDKLWVGTLLEEDADVVYKKRLKTIQSLSYVFENDCRKLFEGETNPNNVLRVEHGEYPKLLKMALRKEITYETFCLLNNLLEFVNVWDRQITDTIRWPEFRKRMVKYASFLPKDSVKYKLILKKVLGD